MMWKLVICTLCLLSGSLQLCSGSFWGSPAVDKVEEEVKVEVLFKPLPCEPKSKKGDLINIHYDGFLAEDGSQFFCSRSAGHPQWLMQGVGQVIKGLDMGLKDVCAGEKRKITIPPALAFGVKGKDPVPPNATVVFEVEIFAVSSGPRSLETFRKMDVDKDRSLSKAEIKEYFRLDYERIGDPHEDPFYDKIVVHFLLKNDHDKDDRISMKEYNIYEHDEL